MSNRWLGIGLVGVIALANIGLVDAVRAEQAERGASATSANRSTARTPSARPNEARENPASIGSRLVSPPGRPLAFTEEREAAAKMFVNNHLPEMGAVLEQLRQGKPAEYRQVICDLFKTSELLATMRQDDPTRHELALRGWRIEAQTQLLAAGLVAHPDQREQLMTELQRAVEELADLQIEQAAYEAKRLEAKARRADGQRKQLEGRRNEFVKQRLGAILQAVEGPEESPSKSVSPSTR